MNRALQRYVEAASGLTNLTTAKAEQIVKQLVRQGEAAQDQMGELVDDLLDRQRRNREAAAELVKQETTRAVRVMGLATSEEVERLERRVAELNRELSRIEGQVGRTRATGGGAAKKASKAGTKKASTKKAKKTTSGRSAKSATSATSAKKASKKASKKGTSGTRKASATGTARKSSGS